VKNFATAESQRFILTERRTFLRQVTGSPS
jgi:hypothetical protein